MRRPLCHISRLLLIAILLTSLALVTGGMLSCTAPQLDEHLVGHACTAEAISMGTAWSWNESATATPAQKLLLMIAGLVLLVVATLRFSHKTHRGFSWFNRRLNLARPGPAPHGLFLPYLFATHDL